MDVSAAPYMDTDVEQLCSLSITCDLVIACLVELHVAQLSISLSRVSRLQTLLSMMILEREDHCEEILL